MNSDTFATEAARFIVDNENPSLREQLKHLIVARTDKTGAGLVFEFENSSASRSLVQRQTLGSSVTARANGAVDLGFVLYVDDGMISSLETFVHGYEDFPASIIDCNFHVLR